MALATKVYENIQKEQAANGDNETSSNDDVKEADYEEDE